MHGYKFVLSIAFKFSSSNLGKLYQFSLLCPFNYTMLIAFLERWKLENKRWQNMIDKYAMSTHLSKHNIESVKELEKKNNSRKSIQFDYEQIEASNSLSRESLLVKLIFNRMTRYECEKRRIKVIVLWQLASGNLQAPAGFVVVGLLDSLLANQTFTDSLPKFHESTNDDFDVCKDLSSKLIDITAIGPLDPLASWCGNSKTGIAGQQTRALFWAPHSRLCKRVNNSQIFAMRDKFIEEVSSMPSSNKEEDYRSGKKTSRHINLLVLEIGASFSLLGSRLVGCRYVQSCEMEQHASFARYLAEFEQSFQLENCKFVMRVKKRHTNNKPACYEPLIDW